MYEYIDGDRIVHSTFESGRDLIIKTNGRESIISSTDWLASEAYEFERKGPPLRIETRPDEFDDCIMDNYIDCGHMCRYYILKIINKLI